MVYIIHFEKPFKHAKHYVGYCDDQRFEERIAEHRQARYQDSFMGKVNAAGIGWHVARTIPGADENLERRIKEVWKRTSALCPCCTDKPRKIYINGQARHRVSDLRMWERYWDQKTA